MSLYEPTSLDKLVNKGESLHQRSMSPRGFRSSMNESDMVRRTSSYGIPAQDAIAERESSSSDDDLIDKPEVKPLEEEKEDDKP